MDRRTLKIETPLPRLPRLQSIRFTLRTLFLLVALLAIGLGIFRYAAERERSRYDGARFHVVVSTPDGMVSQMARCKEHNGLASVIEMSGRQISRINHEVDARELWPPTVWIKRDTWEDHELEKRIDVECGGTFDEPEFLTTATIQSGDRVFIDYGRPKPMSREDVASILSGIPSHLRFLLPTEENVK